MLDFAGLAWEKDIPMKKQSIDHIAKLLAGTSVVVVSSLLTVASASAAAPDATALHERTEQVVGPVRFGEGTLCRVTSKRD